MISRLTARADRRHRQLLVAAGKGAGIADAGVQRRGQPGEDAPRPERHDGANKMMIVSDIFDPHKRLRSFEITAEANGGAPRGAKDETSDRKSVVTGKSV